MMVSPNFSFDQVQMSFLDYLSEAETARQKAIVAARNYHEGNHEVHLSDRMKEFLNLQGDSNKFRLNVCRAVVSAVSERLIVAGFDTSEQPDANEEKLQAKWAWEVWQANRMDAKQDDVHDGTLRDGEFFVIVDWDGESGYPRFTPHQRFCSTETSGDGFGVRMIYPDDNLYSPPSYAVKEWTETLWTDKGRQTRRRRTFYYPNRIERFFYDMAGWKPLEEPGQTWPVPWVDAATRPLGIPVIHFANKDLRCEAWDAIPMQDATNKTLIDLLAAADMSAFRVFVALGWIPTKDGKPPATDGSNWLQIAPGQVLGTTRSKAEAGMEVIEPADLGGLRDLVNQEIFWTAAITDTPVSRFVASGQVASADTLKEQQEPLEAKVINRRVRLGNGWEDCMAMARKLANLYGGAGLNETVRFSTAWTFRRSLDELKQKKEIGIPNEQLWLEAGYSQEQIAAMKESDEYQAKMALMQAGFGQEQDG